MRTEYIVAALFGTAIAGITVVFALIGLADAVTFGGVVTLVQLPICLIAVGVARCLHSRQPTQTKRRQAWGVAAGTVRVLAFWWMVVQVFGFGFLIGIEAGYWAGLVEQRG